MKLLSFAALVALAVLPCLPSCGCGGDSDLTPPPESLPPPPEVVGVLPPNGGADAPLDTNIVIDFDLPVLEGTVGGSTFRVIERGGAQVPGVITWTIPNLQATFNPAGDLLPCTIYDVVVAAAVTDVYGQHIPAFASSFTTTGDCSPPQPPGPCVPPIPFLTAAPYAVLAGSTITNTGPTTLDGDLGLSPGTAVTGSPIVTGVSHVADAAALQAQNDLITAYNAAVVLPSTATRIGDIGGQILTAGVYTSSSALSVLSADLILVGGPNDVFVFQMVSALNVGSGRKVLLQGVRSCNVIWQVGSSATLETGAQFAGSILALTSIILKTGATVDGRVLARNGQVVFDTNTVTVP